MNGCLEEVNRSNTDRVYGKNMPRLLAEKIDEYDSKTMSTEDAKYYIEVTSRCSQKMLDIYGK